MRPVLITIALCLLAASLAAQIDGPWTGIDDQEGGVHLQVVLGVWNQQGHTIALDQLEGLSATTVRSTEQASAHFRIAREAGTIVFDGTFRDGNGGGQYRFTPNPSYAAAIRKLGLDMELRENQSETKALLFATLIDLSTPYIRGLQKIFPEMTFRDARNARGAGVTLKFVRELAAAGYKNVSVRDLGRLAAHGVDKEYIHEMSKYKSMHRQENPK